MLDMFYLEGEELKMLRGCLSFFPSSCYTLYSIGFTFFHGLFFGLWEVTYVQSFLKLWVIFLLPTSLEDRFVPSGEFYFSCTCQTGNKRRNMKSLFIQIFSLNLLSLDTFPLCTIHCLAEQPTTELLLCLKSYKVILDTNSSANLQFCILKILKVIRILCWFCFK